LSNAKERTNCRVCGHAPLKPILSLGEQYITNFVDAGTQNPAKGPLAIVLCSTKDGGCGLLQMQHTTDQDALYRTYWYQSGLSTTMIAALRDIVQAGQKIVPLQPGDIVIDIGANDGTLLRQYDRKDIKTVGFEPSNLWQMGQAGNTKIIHDYFNHESFARELGPNTKAKVITAISMFYDLENPNAFVQDIKKCLAPDGVWIISMNYLVSMLEQNTFDNISHEHLEYYSLLSLKHLMDRNGMEIFDVETNDVNGGSFRIYLKHKGAHVNAFPGGTERVNAMLEHERKIGLEEESTYKAFAQRIENIKHKILKMLREEHAKGKKIYIYGASTRGQVVLQYAGIDHTLVAAATDKNKDKWGKFIVGTGIPIVSIEQYRKDNPDFLFVLPYHFIREIQQQEMDWLKKGHHMIVAIPEVRVIDANTKL
jgi:hypothetical protein